MAFEVLGKNVLSLIKKYEYRGIPIPVVRRMTRQLLLGLDYMHRVCGIIHTDLKPENAVFALTERQKFQLLYEHVLCGPLIDMFETSSPIILNSKQLKNQKKKERKKKKKQAENEANLNEEDGDKPEIEHKKKGLQGQQQSENQMSKTQAVVEEFNAKIEKNEAKYWIAPIYQRIRSNSWDFTAEPFFDSEDISIQEPAIHPLKKSKHQVLRIASQPRTQAMIEDCKAFKPLRHRDVARMKEEDLQVKLCDMGNACYIEEHYSEIIQTREYRSPEVILGGSYDETADIWSLACMIFELVTGDYLFDPRKGKTYRKNDDHLALISELIGPCKDRVFLQSCSKFQKFYDKNKNPPKLRNIPKLKDWPLYRVLLEKYRLKDTESSELSDFLN